MLELKFKNLLLKHHKRYFNIQKNNKTLKNEIQRKPKRKEKKKAKQNTLKTKQ